MKKLLTLLLLGSFKVAFATDGCNTLLGEWQGDWKSANNVESTAIVFTSTKNNKFFGYYYFKSSPQNQVKFEGDCIVTDYGYLALAFAQALPKPEICLGALNDKESLWLGCPYGTMGGTFNKTR